MSEAHDEAVRARFAATAAGVAEHSARQVERVREELRDFLPLTGKERALDSGTGAGVLALALAPLVREVVGVDLVPELLAAARAAAPRTRPSSRATPPRCRSRPAPSTWPAAGGRCTTSPGPSSRSPSSLA